MESRNHHQSAPFCCCLLQKCFYRWKLQSRAVLQYVAAAGPKWGLPLAILQGKLNVYWLECGDPQNSNKIKDRECTFISKSPKDWLHSYVTCHLIDTCEGASRVAGGGCCNIYSLSCLWLGTFINISIRQHKAVNIITHPQPGPGHITAPQCEQFGQ